MVGAMSITWLNWVRTWPTWVMRLGQLITMPSRRPPRWEAMRLPHCSGALVAQPQAAG